MGVGLGGVGDRDVTQTKTPGVSTGCSRQSLENRLLGCGFSVQDVIPVDQAVDEGFETPGRALQ